MNNKLKAALITAALMTIPGLAILTGLQFPHEALTIALVSSSGFVVYGIYKGVYSQLEDEDVSSKR